MQANGFKTGSKNISQKVSFYDTPIQTARAKAISKYRNEEWI